MPQWLCWIINQVITGITLHNFCKYGDFTKAVGREYRLGRAVSDWRPTLVQPWEDFGWQIWAVLHEGGISNDQCWGIGFTHTGKLYRLWFHIDWLVLKIYLFTYYLHGVSNNAAQVTECGPQWAVCKQHRILPSETRVNAACQLAISTYIYRRCLLRIIGIFHNDLAMMYFNLFTHHGLFFPMQHGRH